MKITIFAVVCLMLGAWIGTTLGRQEFAAEKLPFDKAEETGSAAAGSEALQGPRVTLLTPERYRFGFIDRNSKMNHTFEIRNDGDAPLTVRKKGTSCKCTSAGLDKDQLLPGEMAKITLEWTGKGMGVTEFFEQYAEYDTNDVRRPMIKFIVEGEIRATLRAEPSEAVFNRVSAQEPARATVRIMAFGDEELKIVSHRFEHAKSAPFFTLDFEPLNPDELPPNSEYKSGLLMHVDLKPGLPLGQMAQTIKITTNRNPEETFDIPVYGSVVSDISLIGPNTSAATMTVDLGSFKSRQGAKATVYLVVKGPHRDQTALQVASVQPAAELTAMLGEPDRDNPQIVRYPLTFEVLPGATPVSRVSSGSRIAVRIETTHPQIKELTVFAKYAVVD
jgi:hypothetical protein